MSPRRPHRLAVCALLTTALLLAPAGLVAGQTDAPGPATPASPAEETAVLHVLVTARGPDHRGPVDGAAIVVYELVRDRNGSHAEPAARGATHDGWIRFELPTGAYGLRATAGDHAGHAKVRLHDDRRVHVQLADDRSDRQPGPYHLGLAALTLTDGGTDPLPGATIVVERLVRPHDGNLTWEPVFRAITDGDGHVTETLPGGVYKATLTTEDGAEEVRRFKLDHDRWLRLHVGAPDDPASEEDDRRWTNHRDGAPGHRANSHSHRPDRPGPSDQAAHEAILAQLAKISRILGGLVG